MKLWKGADGWSASESDAWLLAVCRLAYPELGALLRAGGNLLLTLRQLVRRGGAAPRTLRDLSKGEASLPLPSPCLPCRHTWSISECGIRLHTSSQRR